jgi:hypothetical protein
MTKLRDDVRGAFDQEQASLGDVGDARHRLVHNAMAAREVPASRGLQLAAGIAAVLIAAIVVATFALVLAGNQSHVVPATTPTPRAAVSPTPLRNALNVPDSTPIIAFGDPAKTDQVDGITWDGKRFGVLPNQNLAGQGNPANNLFATATEIRDRAGSLIASDTYGAKYFGGTWADDEIHFCQMVPYDYLGANGVPASLQLGSPGQAPRNVAQLGKVYEQTSIGVAACSVLNDRAVVVQRSTIGTAAQYWVVQLSTGRVIWTHNFQETTAIVQVAVSRDGMYVAEHQDPGGATGSTIYGPDGTNVGHLDAVLEAFSWDGALAVTDAGYGTAPVKVVTWRDGGVVWAAPAGHGLQQAKPQPGGSELAIWVIPTAQFSQQTYSGDLYVISSSGKVLIHIANTP